MSRLTEETGNQLAKMRTVFVDYLTPSQRQHYKRVREVEAKYARLLISRSFWLGVQFASCASFILALLAWWLCG